MMIFKAIQVYLQGQSGLMHCINMLGYLTCQWWPWFILAHKQLANLHMSSMYHACMYVCMYVCMISSGFIISTDHYVNCRKVFWRMYASMHAHVYTHTCIIWYGMYVTVRHRGSVNNTAYDCGFRSKIKSSTDSYVRMCVCVCACVCVQYIPDLYLVTL